MKCKHLEWKWFGKPEFIGGNEVMIPLKCDKCDKKGCEILKSIKIVWAK